MHLKSSSQQAHAINFVMKMKCVMTWAVVKNLSSALAAPAASLSSTSAVAPVRLCRPLPRPDSLRSWAALCEGEEYKYYGIAFLLLFGV